MDDDVDVAIVVEIAEGCAATDMGRFEGRAALTADVGETAIAEVAKQQVALAEGKGISLADQIFLDRHPAVDRSKSPDL